MKSEIHFEAIYEENLLVKFCKDECFSVKFEKEGVITFSPEIFGADIQPFPSENKNFILKISDSYFNIGTDSIDFASFSILEQKPQI